MVVAAASPLKREVEREIGTVREEGFVSSHRTSSIFFAPHVLCYRTRVIGCEEWFSCCFLRCIHAPLPLGPSLEALRSPEVSARALPKVGSDDMSGVAEG